MLRRGCETSRLEQQAKSEPAACASLLVSAHPLAMTRMQWADKNGQRKGGSQKESVRFRSSRCQGVGNDAKDMLNNVLCRISVGARRRSELVHNKNAFHQMRIHGWLRAFFFAFPTVFATKVAYTEKTIEDVLLLIL